MKKIKGFTLIEMLVVVAIIALLISILLPSLSKARELARRTVCGANVKDIGTTLYIYQGDNLDVFPTSPHTVHLTSFAGELGCRFDRRTASTIRALQQGFREVGSEAGLRAPPPRVVAVHDVAALVYTHRDTKFELESMIRPCLERQT